MTGAPLPEGADTVVRVEDTATGRMAGDYPKSFWKVFFLVLGIIIVVLVVLLLQGDQ